MLSEQFIQDAFTNHQRIQRVFRDEFGIDLEIDDHGDQPDTVNREYSFSHNGVEGRVDIIATFESRTKVMLCEVKKGMACDAHLEQLIWYVDKWSKPESKVWNEELKKAELIGVLLAEDFSEFDTKLVYQASELNIQFLRFRFDGCAFPFSKHDPVKSPSSRTLEKKDKTPKQSQLLTVSDWKKDCSDKIKNKFERFLNCFLEPDSGRHKWLTPIFQSWHVAVHYKGEYIMWLYPRPKADRLDGAYGYEGDDERILDSLKEDVVKKELESIMDKIDQKYEDIIGDFVWEQ